MIPASSVRAALAATAVAALAGCDTKIADPSDRIAPEVTITSPAGGSQVSGISFVVTADATDETGIDRVEFQIAGFAPIPATEVPYGTRIVTFGRTAGATVGITATAFDTNGNASSDFITVTVANRTITRITTNPDIDRDPSWSPSGTRIVYEKRESGVTGTFDLWTIAPDGSNPTRITFDTQDDRNPAWSPDGLWIAFDSNRAGQFDVYKLPLAQGESGLVPLTVANKDDVEPAWTPDGQFVYFASNRGDNAPFNIWRATADGATSNTVQITSFNDPDTSPAVSSDGRFLAFSSRLNFATPHVYLMEIGMQQVVPLSGDIGRTELDPAFSPEGNVVSFTRSEGGLPSQVWLQERLGTAVLQGTFGTGPTGDGGCVWSPDGTKVAFHSDRDGNLDLFVVE